MRIAQRLFIAALTITLLLGPITPVAQGANCQFTLGFKNLHDLIPAIVGDCLENEHYSWFNGDGIQRTTKGILVWRRDDNFTAFTDGSHTWILGPNGVQERLNGDRFPWEADYTMIFEIQSSDLPKGYVPVQPQTGPMTNENAIAFSPVPSAERLGLKQLGRIGGYRVAFFHTAPAVNGQAGTVASGINQYQTVAGAQLSWNDDWATTPDGWQKVSAPPLGDQSAVFVNRVPLAPEFGKNLNIFDYLIHVRVGTFLVYVETIDVSTSSTPDQAIALARVIVGRIQAHR